MKEKNEIKKVLYKEKPTAVKTGVTATEPLKVTYLAATSLGQHMFLIPQEEALEFADELPAQLLIRWLIVVK